MTVCTETGTGTSLDGRAYVTRSRVKRRMRLADSPIRRRRSRLSGSPPPGVWACLRISQSVYATIDVSGLFSSCTTPAAI